MARLGLIPGLVTVGGLAVVAAAVAAPPSRSAATQPASDPSGRIFTWRQAERARSLAREECKPLVVHFVPDTRLGSDQLQAFYARPGGVPQDLLEEVVIVVAPTERFGKFARDLGITGIGGYRTISAYDLSPLDQKSQPTCRSGFV